MKSAIGLLIGFLLGFACRYFDIPVPSPPKLLGAVLVVATTVGYLAADRVLAKPPVTKQGVTKQEVRSLDSEVRMTPAVRA
jgi:XapX domain-containing protein